MSIRILHLQETPIQNGENGFPFIDVELVFRIEGSDPASQSCKAEAEGLSQEFRLSNSIDNPESYLEWLKIYSLDFDEDYPGRGQSWVIQDPVLTYNKDKQLFTFGESVADCLVTQSALLELKHYYRFRKFAGKYRHSDEFVFMSLIHTLKRLWD